MSTSVTIIGGGILGLAIAERLSRTMQVTVLEKEQHWAAHQTGHNSGVVHGGPYYAPGSLKARMCVAGNRSMIAFAEENGIDHRVTGKLIAAVDAAELARLHMIADRAKANGVPARMLTAGEAQELEPHLSTVGALHVQTTGIIDYGAVSRALAQRAELAGARLLRSARVTAVRPRGDKIVVEHTRGHVESAVLINCSGLHADRIAALSGVTPEVRIVPFRGEYYELAAHRRALVNGLIYPVPDPDLPFLGVHLTRMIDGSVHAGPNAVLALAREGYSWRHINPRDVVDTLGYPGFLRMASRNIGLGAAEIARSFSQHRFAASLARLVPEIGAADIVRAGSGVRAQAIRRDGSLADDFIIQRAPRQLHVLNAPSPAATSSLEIARHIAAEVSLLQ